MPLLYYWRADNHARDQEFGFGYHLSQNSPAMASAGPGDSLWAFTRRRRDGLYILAAELVESEADRLGHERRDHRAAGAGIPEGLNLDGLNLSAAGIEAGAGERIGGIAERRQGDIDARLVHRGGQDVQVVCERLVSQGRGDKAGRQCEDGALGGRPATDPGNRLKGAWRVHDRWEV